MHVRTVYQVMVALGAVAALQNCQCSSPPGSTCESAQDCAGNYTCDPDTSKCATVECTTHAQCGAGSYCSADECKANEEGGPCSADSNCISGEQCRGGLCLSIGGAGSTCRTAEECTTPLVCNPSSGTCGTGGACTQDSQCGTAAHCASGTCTPATPASGCTTDDNCLAAERCVGVVCVPDACMGEAYSAEAVPSNVLLVVDRSGSMEESLGQEGTKWEVAKAAVGTLLQSFTGNIRFGLNVYPGTDPACNQGSRCSAGVVAVDVGDNTASAINNYLANADTCSLGTPTAENLSMVQSYTGLRDTTRSNYVFLITDGASTCDNPVPEVQALANAGIPTYVIGFGGGVDPQELRDMARAGGTARSGNPEYYQADSSASLNQALTEIAGAVLSCDYTIPNGPASADDLIVYFNAQPVPRDPTRQTGWDYTPSTRQLRFSGNACQALRAGVVTELTIVYGCPGGSQPDAGVPRVDAGPPPRVDAGPPGSCTDRCTNNCGVQACLLPAGTCGNCRTDTDCCTGSLCLSDGTCLPLGG